MDKNEQNKDKKEQKENSLVVSEKEQEDRKDITNQVKSEDSEEQKKSRKSKIIVGSIALPVGLVIGILGTTVFHNMTKNGLNDSIPKNLVTGKISGKHHNFLTSTRAFNLMINSQINQRALLSYSTNSMLKAKYGNDQEKNAKKKINQIVGQVGGQNKFDQIIQARGMTPENYLISVENVLMLRNAIYRSYEPTNAQIQNSYNQLTSKYDLKGIIITEKKNGSLTESKKLAEEIKTKIDSGKLTYAKAISEYSNSKVSISGIGHSQDQTKIDNVIVGTDSIIPNNVAKTIKLNKVGDTIIQNNQSYGTYLVTISKLHERGTLKQEKKTIINQLKSNASTDQSQQLKLTSKLIKESGMKSSNEQIQKLISDTTISN